MSEGKILYFALTVMIGAICYKIGSIATIEQERRIDPSTETL